MARMVRAGGAAMGCSLPVADGAASPTVTALIPPEGVTVKAVREWCRHAGVVLAGGQGTWAGRVIRVGHVGNVGPVTVLGGLGVLERAIAALTGGRLTGDGVAAALRMWHDADGADPAHRAATGQGEQSAIDHR
jgi:aspartate aminotransferase-like enzyme